MLDRLLRAGLAPQRGRLTFGFANLAAFDRFDAAQPTASRFVDEDMNRLWDAGGAGRRAPLRSNLTARGQMRPLIDTVDVLLDLHSMLWPSEPLMLSGGTAKGRALARGDRRPPLVVADRGHVSGRRLIDYGRFRRSGRAAVGVLVEAGQHWEPTTVEMTLASVAGLLRHLGMAARPPALPPPRRRRRPAALRRGHAGGHRGDRAVSPSCGRIAAARWSRPRHADRA